MFNFLVKIYLMINSFNLANHHCKAFVNLVDYNNLSEEIVILTL